MPWLIEHKQGMILTDYILNFISRMLKKIIIQFINSQKYLSAKFDRLLPQGITRFANDIFDYDVLPRYLSNGLTVADIGGGKHPNISAEHKKKYGVKIIGLDISEEELSQAPEGIYDQAIAADITQFNDCKNNDVIICRALLEHVPDVEKSLKNIADMTKENGHVLIFGPCKNAFFSRINMIIPHGIKRKLLHFAFPSHQKRIGFKAYYDHCTPKEFIKIAGENGLKVEEKYISYNSLYLSIFTPAHVLWRLYQLVIYSLGAENFCEAYVLVLSKSE